jgi:hypothetical protein
MTLDFRHKFLNRLTVQYLKRNSTAKRITALNFYSIAEQKSRNIQCLIDRKYMLIFDFNL